MLLKVSASYADLHLFTPNSTPLPHPEAVTLSFTLSRNLALTEPHHTSPFGETERSLTFLPPKQGD